MLHTYIYVSARKLKDIEHQLDSNNVKGSIRDSLKRIGSLEITPWIKLELKENAQEPIKQQSMKTVSRLDKLSDAEPDAENGHSVFRKIEFTGCYNNEIPGLIVFGGKTEAGDEVVLFGSRANFYDHNFPNQDHEDGGSWMLTFRKRIFQYLKDHGIIDTAAYPFDTYEGEVHGHIFHEPLQFTLSHCEKSNMEALCLNSAIVEKTIGFGRDSEKLYISSPLYVRM